MAPLPKYVLDLTNIGDVVEHAIGDHTRAMLRMAGSVEAVLGNATTFAAMQTDVANYAARTMAEWADAVAGFNAIDLAIEPLAFKFTPPPAAVLRSVAPTEDYRRALETMARFTEQIRGQEVTAEVLVEVASLAGEHIEDGPTDRSSASPLPSLQELTILSICLVTGALAMANTREASELQRQLGLLWQVLALALSAEWLTGEK